MGRIYGYCRVSTSTQNIERQIRNIKAAYPDAIIVEEFFTGTNYQGRVEFVKLLNKVEKGDSIIFDSVSRMSRNAEQGFELYQQLFKKGIKLVFLKEAYVNTEVYANAVNNKIDYIGDKVDFILEGVNKYLMEVAKTQIKIAFEQSEKEVLDLHQRTKEGIETARLNGKQIGQKKGNKLNIKKKAPALENIKKYSKDFNGSLNDTDCIKLVGISRSTFYSYKKELMAEKEKEVVKAAEIENEQDKRLIDKLKREEQETA